MINFEIIHHECWGDPLKGTYEGYKTIKAKDLKNYPNPEKKKISWGYNKKYQDERFICLFVKIEVVNNHFKL